MAANRLAELQQLLKDEEAEQNAQRKTLNSVEQTIQQTRTSIISSYRSLCEVEVQIASASRSQAAADAGEADTPEAQPPLSRPTHGEDDVSLEVRRSVTEFIEILKDNCEVFLDALERANLLPCPTNPASLREIDDICHAIVFSVCNNCLVPEDEKRALNIIKQLWGREFSLWKRDNPNTSGETLPAMTMTTRLITEYLKATSGSSYLFPVLKDVIVVACNLVSFNTQKSPQLVEPVIGRSPPSDSPNQDSVSPVSPSSSAGTSDSSTATSPTSATDANAPPSAALMNDPTLRQIDGEQLKSKKRGSFLVTAFAGDNLKRTISHKVRPSPLAPLMPLRSFNAKISNSEPSADGKNLATNPATLPEEPSSLLSQLSKPKDPRSRGWSIVSSMVDVTESLRKYGTSSGLSPTKEYLPTAAMQPWLISYPYLAQVVLFNIIDSSSSIPYVLRWITKTVLADPAVQTAFDGDHAKANVVMELFFRNLIFAAIERPEDWGLGIHSSENADVLHTLSLNLAELVSLLLTVKPTTDTLQLLTSKLEMFVDSFTDVGDLEEFFEQADKGRTPVEFVSTEDLKALLTLISKATRPKTVETSSEIVESTETKQPDENILERKSSEEAQSDEKPSLNSSSETASHSQDSPSVEMDEHLKRLSQLSDIIISKSSTPLFAGVTFICIYDATTDGFDDRSSEESDAKVVPALVKNCMKQISFLLRIIETVCGSCRKGIISLIKDQQVRNRTLQANILGEMISQTVQMLESLPTEWKQDDYGVLIERMIEDVKKRREALRNQLNPRLFFLTKLQMEMTLIEARKKFEKDRLAAIQIYTLARGYEGVGNFVEFFQVSFPAESLPCSCAPSAFEEHVCPVCREKARLFTELISRFCAEFERRYTHFVSAEGDGNGGITSEMSKNHTHKLEEYVSRRVFKIIFPTLQADLEFYSRCSDLAPDLRLSSLMINPKFHYQAPWQQAQNELRKISMYTGPYEKFLCILDTWKIILGYLRPLVDNVSADDFLPIMAYVILKANPADFLSTVQYILLYTSLDESETMWMMHLKSSLEIVTSIFDGKIPHWRQVRPSSSGRKSTHQRRVLLGRGSSACEQHGQNGSGSSSIVSPKMDPVIKISPTSSTPVSGETSPSSAVGASFPIFIVPSDVQPVKHLMSRTTSDGVIEGGFAYPSRVTTHNGQTIDLSLSSSPDSVHSANSDGGSSTSPLSSSGIEQVKL